MLTKPAQKRITNVLVDVRGEVLCLSEIARRYGVNKATIQRRYHKGERGDRLIRQPKGGPRGWE
jgi:transposase